MRDEAQQAEAWEFVAWSEEGRDGFSVCLHRGPLESQDHICIGYAPTKDSAEHRVHHANEWLAATMFGAGAHSREFSATALSQAHARLGRTEAELAVVLAANGVVLPVVGPGVSTVSSLPSDPRT